jgi:FtsZ-binding cell division protein ZapB
MNLQHVVTTFGAVVVALGGIVAAYRAWRSGQAEDAREPITRDSAIVAQQQQVTDTAVALVAVLRTEVSELRDKQSSLQREFDDFRSIWMNWYSDLRNRWETHRQHPQPPNPPH